MMHWMASIQVLQFVHPMRTQADTGQLK